MPGDGRESVKVGYDVVLPGALVIAKHVVFPSIRVGAAQVSSNELLKNMRDMERSQGQYLCWLSSCFTSNCVLPSWTWETPLIGADCV